MLMISTSLLLRAATSPAVDGCVGSGTHRISFSCILQCCTLTPHACLLAHATAISLLTQTGREIYERLLSCTVDEILDDDELLMVVSNGAFYYKRRSL